MKDALREEAGGRSRAAAVAPAQTTTDLPLQAQLMGSLALVFILSAIAGIVGYATYDPSALEESTRGKATMYAANLAAQLYSPVARADTYRSSKIIEPLRSDPTVYGVAVYLPGGSLLAGHGKFPPTLTGRGSVDLDD